MLVSPSKLVIDRIVKKRTINFETVKKTHGNLVIVAGKEESDLFKIAGSKLFRPQQLMASFIPRVVRPMGRKPVRINQKEFYKRMREATNGKVKLGKTMPNVYNGMNLLYNIIPDYYETSKVITDIRGENQLTQKTMYEYLENIFRTTIDNMNYEKNYLILPMVDGIENLRGSVISDFKTLDPLILLLRAMKRNTLDLELYKKFDLILFYSPRGEVLYPLNLREFDIEKEFNTFLNRLMRINNFNLGVETLEDNVDEGEVNIDEDDEMENTKEEIKDLVLSNIAKKLKIRGLKDFEAATKDEQDIMLTIDRKIEEYLKDPENIEKPFSELVAEIERDKEVITKATRYVDTKRVSEKKMSELSKNLEREVEVINSIDDLDLEDDILEPDTFDIQGVDERVKRSRLSSLDEEYNKKQAKKDMMNILSSFSSSHYLPMTLEDFRIEDTSDDFRQIDTIYVKFKTDEGKILSFSLDIPKIVDKRYFFLGGNKKVLTKQLVRLPIVKTKPERVEITTNYNKITIERTNGKLSRRNAYLLKILKEYKNNKAVDITLGSNSIINANYNNDFEFDELAGEISLIETPKYELIFNRKDMEEEIAMMDIDVGFIVEGMTPVGFNKSTKALLYIQDNKLFSYTVKGKEAENTEIAPSLFDFIMQVILDRKPDEKLPQIGKSFIFTRMKILGETYPVFVVIGLMNGITDILKRYKVEYRLSDKRVKKNPDYVEVRFKDKYLYYKDTIKNTLLLNILYAMGTEEYDFSDFDLEQPYLDYFIDKLDQPVYVKNTLRMNLNVLIDPITKDVLSDLKLPTDPIDLLLLANTMLTSNSYRPQNDIRNFRIRGNEIVYAMMYQMISDAYVSYQRAKINGRNITNLDIPREKLISKLLTEPNINDHSTLNPVLEMENIASVSAKGFRGINLGSAFTLELRAYDESMVGVIAGNATPFSANSGITRGITYDPNINSVRGYVTDIENKSQLDATNILSPAEMISSFTSTHADPPR